MTKYAICRILGNELPPRDLDGSRLAVFEYILKNEYVGPDTTRVWILNRFLDLEHSARVREKIKAQGERYVELGIDWHLYTSSSSRVERLVALIGINHARNEAFKAGQKYSDFAFVLDGDCFFDRRAWDATVTDVEHDQVESPFRQYYAVPSIRISLEQAQSISIETVEAEEPMLLFRRDAELLFDEGLPFGKADKETLLKRLGLTCQGKRWYPLNSEGPCKVVGWNLHLNTGQENVESDGLVRFIQRRQSLNAALRKADRIAANNVLTSSVSKFLSFKLRSWFMHTAENTVLTLHKMWMVIKFRLRAGIPKDSKSQY